MSTRAERRRAARPPSYENAPKFEKSKPTDLDRAKNKVRDLKERKTMPIFVDGKKI